MIAINVRYTGSPLHFSYRTVHMHDTHWLISLMTSPCMHACNIGINLFGNDLYYAPHNITKAIYTHCLSSFITNEAKAH